MASLRAAIIGAGILGGNHARYLHGRDDVSVVGIADIRLDAAQSLAAQVGAEAFTDYVEMIRALRPDLVVVATPDPLHRAPSVAAIEAGVPNVIQEKPFATTMADAEAIYEAVESRRARFFVNYANRGDPLAIASGYIIQKGLLGRVVYGDVRLDDNISVPTQMWGSRTKDWAAGSSTAHFLLSHVVDLLRWYLAPAEVRDVYAVAQQTVLEYTPDLYDAYLTFDSGAIVRVKAEWIRHMDELVEFYLSFSGAEGTLIHNKRPGFNTHPGWRANLSASVSTEDLLAHRDALAARGANVAALVHSPSPSTGWLSAGGQQVVRALEVRRALSDQPQALVGCMIDAILNDTLTPESWKGHGPLPTHVDGLAQARITTAIVDSAESGRAISLTP